MSTLHFDNSVVTNMVDEALAFCAEKAGLKSGAQVKEILHKGDCCVCEYMRYGIARAMAGYLGAVDDTIQAIYTYEPEQATRVDEAIPSRPNLTPGLNMIIMVSRKSAALASAMASMRSAWAEEHKRLGCPKANAMCSEVDFRAVDEDEIAKRTGYAALLTSLHVQPIEVWHR